MTTTAAMNQAVHLGEADAGYAEGWCSSSVSNKTKYGAWYGMDCNAWCAMAVSKWYYDAGTPQPASTSKGFSYTPSGASWYQSKGAWSPPSAAPERGWVVFFHSDSAGRISHVGLVRGPKSGGMVPTVEGNTNGAGSAEGGSVLLKNRDPSQSLSFRIAGYGRPDLLEGGQEWWEMTDIPESNLDQIRRTVWEALNGPPPSDITRKGGSVANQTYYINAKSDTTLANQATFAGQVTELTDDEEIICNALAASTSAIIAAVEANAGQPMTDEQVEALGEQLANELINSDLPEAFVEAFGHALLDDGAADVPVRRTPRQHE